MIKPKIIFLFVLLILFFSNNSFAQKFKKSHFDLNVSLGSRYDDNILKYSDKYIEKLLRHEDEGRFDIDTYDDVYIISKLNASYFFRFFNKKKTKISTSISNSYYINNDIKSWRYFGVGIQQYFAKKASAKFSYSYIPSFYVRNFRDDDLVPLYGKEPGSFSQYSFSKDNYSFWIQNTFSKQTRIRLSASRVFYYHNEHYTEYDSKDVYLGLSLRRPVSKKVKLELAYQFAYSDAKGFDQDFETKENSDESDATFLDNQIDFTLNTQLHRLWKRKNDLTFKIRYSKRQFLTSHLIQNDLLHARRIDNRLSLFATYNIKLSKDTKLSIYYNRYQRKSENGTTDYHEYLSNEKEYGQNQVGVQFTYSIF